MVRALCVDNHLLLHSQLTLWTLPHSKILDLPLLSLETLSAKLKLNVLNHHMQEREIQIHGILSAGFYWPCISHYENIVHIVYSFIHTWKSQRELKSYIPYIHAHDYFSTLFSIAKLIWPPVHDSTVILYMCRHGFPTVETRNYFRKIFAHGQSGKIFVLENFLPYGIYNA